MMPLSNYYIPSTTIRKRYLHYETSSERSSPLPLVPDIYPMLDMKAEKLLAHFDRVIDSPEAVTKLRRLILDLAVRGRLVPQDPTDEPASELLKKIGQEKKKMIEEGTIKKEKVLPPIDEEEKPFGVPEGWEWCRATYPSFLISQKGKKIEIQNVLKIGKYPVVDQGKKFIRGYCNDEKKVIKLREPIILFGDHTRETKLINFDFVVGADGVKLLCPILVCVNYYWITLRWLSLSSRGYASTF